MYYLRKISRLSTISKIRYISSVKDIPADVLKHELATTNNTLSIWSFDDLEKKDDVIKAILLSATSIEKVEFIVFEDSILKQYGMVLDYNEKGKTGYKGFENLHVNLCELNYEKLGFILEIMKKVIDLKNPDLLISINKDMVKQYIREVFDSGLINIENINENLLNDIKKYKLDEPVS